MLKHLRKGLLALCVVGFVSVGVVGCQSDPTGPPEAPKTPAESKQRKDKEG